MYKLQSRRLGTLTESLIWIKVMFSQVFVCGGGGFHVTIIHDALELGTPHLPHYGDQKWDLLPTQC